MANSRLLTELPKELLISVLCYLEPFWVSWLQNNTKDRELRQRITNLIPKLKLKHPSKTIRPFPGPSFIDYGRMTVRPILHQENKTITKIKQTNGKIKQCRIPVRAACQD